MKQKYYLIFGLITIIGVILISGCTTQPKTTGGDYAPGEINVGFYDNVTEEEANSLIESYNLIWESKFPREFSYWIRVLIGSPDTYISDLETSEIVSWADVRGKPEEEPEGMYILVHFNINATHETAQELIDSFENLEVVSVLPASKRGSIKVPEGEEQKWIEIFEKEEIVRYAELNSIYRLADEETNYLYYMIPIAIVILIIILYPILRKKKK